MVDKFSLSIPNEYLNKVKNLTEEKKFKSTAEGFQYILDTFFNKSKWDTAKTAMLIIGYPAIIMIIMLYIIRNTQDVNTILLENKILTDLLLHSQIYSVISFGFMGIMIAGFVFFLYARGKK